MLSYSLVKYHPFRNVGWTLETANVSFISKLKKFTTKYTQNMYISKKYIYWDVLFFYILLLGEESIVKVYLV